MIVDAVGNQEFGVLRPAVELLGQPDLVLAQGLAMGAVGILLVGGAPGDVAVNDDQGRPVMGLEKGLVGPFQQLQIVGVAHPGHVPAVAHEPLGHVFAEGRDPSCPRS